MTGAWCSCAERLCQNLTITEGDAHSQPLDWAWGPVLEFLFLHKHHDQEASWGGKGLFSLQFHTAVHHQGSQDWNSSRSEIRSWCRSHGGMLLTGWLSLACSAFSFIEPRLPAQRWPHPQGAFPPWSLIEKMPYIGSHGGISSTEAPFSVITPAVSNWHRTTQYNWPLDNLTHKHITSSLHTYILIHPQGLSNFKRPAVFTY